MSNQDGADRASFERALRRVTPAHVTYGTKWKDGKYLAEFVQQAWALWKAALAEQQPSASAPDRFVSMAARWKLRAMQMEGAGANVAGQFLRECAEELEADLEARKALRTSWFATDEPPVDLRQRAEWHQAQAAECWKKLGMSP